MHLVDLYFQSLYNITRNQTKLYSKEKIIMKKRNLVLSVILIILLICGVFVSTRTPSKLDKNKLEPPISSQDTQGEIKIQDYFQANLPTNYDVKYDNENFEAIITYNGENVGYLSFYNTPDITTDSIVSSIEGMHAYAKTSGNDTNMGTYTIKKVIVSYELSAAEAEQGKEATEDTIHYYYYHNTQSNNLVGDLYFDANMISDSEMDTLSKSIVLKKR